MEDTLKLYVWNGPDDYGLIGALAHSKEEAILKIRKAGFKDTEWMDNGKIVEYVHEPLNPSVYEPDVYDSTEIFYEPIPYL